MHPILRNIIAVIAGVAIGGFVNMSLIMVSGSVIPPPEGVDMTTTEGLQAGMHLMETKHFIMPFLAHALGTLVGALLIAIIAANHKMKFALGIGGFLSIWRNCSCYNDSIARLVHHGRFGVSLPTHGMDRRNDRQDDLQ